MSSSQAMRRPEIRAARPEEAEAVLETLCLAFALNIEAARPIFYADPYYDLSHKRVLALPGVGVVACLTVVPTNIRIGGIPVRAGGIAGVATRPAFQRRGYAAALLAATVPALWDELGYPISLLHPVSAPFYRQFGWEYASRYSSWMSAPASLPQSAGMESVRPISEADWPAVYALHDALTRDGTGTCVRDSRRWRLIQMPVPGREALVYESGGEITGYGIWERRETLQVLEIHGRTEEARRGLLGTLARQPDALTEWDTSPALLRQFGLTPPAAAPEPGVMLRIVNLAAALSAFPDAPLTIMANDALCPQNTLPPRTGCPWLRTDIRTLGRLYLGDRTPSEAHADGLLDCDSLETLTLADRFFPARQPYIAPLDQF